MHIEGVSIVIPTVYSARRDGQVARLLQSVVPQLQGKDEVILVDDGSPQHQRTLFRSMVNSRSYSDHTVRMAFLDKVGISGARNYAIEMVQRQSVLFIDHDVVAMPDWLIEMKQPLAEGNCVQGVTWEQERHTWLDEQHQLWRQAVSKRKARDLGVSDVNTRNFGIPRTALDTIALSGRVFGGSTNQRGGEDIAFGNKIRHAHLAVTHNSQARVLHTGDPSSLGGLMQQKFHHGRGDAEAGVLPPDTFEAGNFNRAVILPISQGVNPVIACCLYMSYVYGATQISTRT